MRLFISFACGTIFGLGLLLAGMTDTTKVRVFLDLFGAWDPTLAFVMGGAILPMAVAWAATRSRRPVFAESFPSRPEPKFDRNLVGGSVLFGLGWGLVGLCPGPALASILFGGMGGLAFLAAMVVGMLAARPIRARLLA